MGQIFDAIIYDINKRECYYWDVDKFHANCYSFSYAVKVIHGLLRKSAYRVMWCGNYTLNKKFADFPKNILLGYSVSRSSENLFMNDSSDSSDSDNNEKDSSHLDHLDENNLDFPIKSYQDAIMFINNNHKTWKKIEIDEPTPVTYTGYLVNHSKKQAVNLKDYYENSVCITRNNHNFLIDIIPPLTETGGGTEMALFDGASSDVTENLVGKWCGDLLQLVDECPKDYKVLSCCFSTLWERARYCNREYGIDKYGFLLKNDKANKKE
ncbi:hypothetical protein PIROE2DRAFT_4741 [Piromyces sp. E2]|nr:hypothetical protein PIROE2DRAFT_4741 [Piromyces sp. E2]|eukprot:OUM67785.1 hypothetical protein PIROE2DRAFT_4741 [Piromyces sp. E2]